MIISRTPLRMSFVGGGSDLPLFYREEQGAVLSTSIDRYIYLCVNTKFDGRVRVSYTKTEEVSDSRQIEHPLVREALMMMNIQGGVEIASMADIPSKGSGLGSSSAFTVGLLNALHAFGDHVVSKDTLAEQACEIEIGRCRQPIGKQDQYASAYGGLNLIRFHPDDSVSVDPVTCKPSLIEEFEDSILVFFTGRTRSAASVLSDQNAAINTNNRRSLMRRMVQIAFEMKEQLELGSLEFIGEMLNENWRLKSQLSSGISNTEIDTLYDIAMASGALGGKLLGAGNGGFLLLFAPKDRHRQITKALSHLKPVKFRFDRTGTQISRF